MGVTSMEGQQGKLFLVKVLGDAGVLQGVGSGQTPVLFGSGGMPCVYGTSSASV